MNDRAASSVAAPAKPASLLLVDDEENILASLRRLLRRDGYRIHVAGGGAEGLQILEREEVDVIVSDQRMPGMTGTEFLKQARTMRPATVRIVLSGYTELESVTAAINEGSVYRFLTKPWDDEHLRRHIAEAVRHKQIEDENRRLQDELQTANEQLTKLLDERQRRLALGEASLHFAHEVMAALPLPVLGVDPDGMVVLANESAHALFAPHLIGLDADAVLPATLRPMLHDDTQQETVSVRIGEAEFRVITRNVGLSGEPRGRLFAFFGQ